MHFIVEDNDECVGTARIVKYEKNKFKIQRVCIKKSKRKLSFGSKLMYKLHQYLIDLNVGAIEISAQTSALKFYKNLGYFEEGSRYQEAGLEHIKMIKKLS
jgi:predicted GNAT family N-acyltransferase